MRRDIAQRRVDVGRVARVAVVLAAGLVATACAAGSGDASPSGRESRSPGEPIEKALGEPASLTLGDDDRSRSRVDLAVTEVVQGDVKDLSDFVLDARTKKSTPYYASVRVTNTGGGDLSGANVPLWGFDSTGTVRPPAEIAGTFGRCPQRPLPSGLDQGESARMCLMFLLPQQTTLEAVQYRFDDETAPFSWPATPAQQP
ncbi:MAG: hypothetical protein ACRDOY_06855 [Nocardioidaceae bacterium]